MHDHLITSDPGGRPVIAGTHVTVEEVLKELATWGEIDRILTAHPELNRDAIQAALEFAAEQLPVLEPSREVPPPPASETFTPSTPFGKEMWALHLAAVEEAKQRGEPLLETWEDVAREVRERHGERDYFEEVLLYERFFARAVQIVPPSVSLLQQAYTEACTCGLAALDALHIAAAKFSGVEEFITTERPTTPLFRVTGIVITTIIPPS